MAFLERGFQERKGISFPWEAPCRAKALNWVQASNPFDEAVFFFFFFSQYGPS